MAFKLVVVLCVSAFFVQTITAQCLSNSALAASGLGLAGNGYLGGAGLGLGYGGLNPAALSNGGGFVVTSTSPITPTGLSVLAENLLIEGPVTIGGKLPLLGVVGVEGSIPTGGQAGANYGCGNGNVGILSELNGATGGPAGIGGLGYGAAGLGVAGLGMGAGLGGCGRIL